MNSTLPVLPARHRMGDHQRRRGPTDDKPTVTLRAPSDPDMGSSFLNIRVADIEKIYSEWSSRGAEFLTEPKDHAREIRCYMRDPDGYLIEIGQSTGTLEAS